MKWIYASTLRTPFSRRIEETNHKLTKIFFLILSSFSFLSNLHRCFLSWIGALAATLEQAWIICGCECEVEVEVSTSLSHRSIQIMAGDSKEVHGAASVLSDHKQLSEEDLCRIRDFQVGELPKNSGFVRPFRASFVDEGSNDPVQRQWDAIDAHVCEILDTTFSSDRIETFFIPLSCFTGFCGYYCVQSINRLTRFRSTIPSCRTCDAQQRAARCLIHPRRWFH